MTDPGDILVWPCGTWCYRCELEDFQHKSDDYMELQAESEEWFAFDSERPLGRWES